MDELMMDWLYDELDPSSSARVAEHVGSCSRCSAEVGALQRTRGAFRDLAELEPPPSVSAILMHEAARRVAAAAPPVPSPSGGRLRTWFEALIRPIAHHPAATAFATLVLVVGVAGALYVRGSMKLSRPESAETISAPADEIRPMQPSRPPSSPIPPAAEPPRSEASARARQAQDGYAADVIDREGQDALEKAGAEPDRDDPRSKVSEARKPDGTSRKGGLARRSAGKEDFEGKPQVKSVPEAGRIAPAPQPGQESAAAAAAPPPAAGPELEELDDRGGQAALRADPQSTQKGWLELQERRLGELVKGRRCGDAAVVANDIRDADPAYYARRLKGSKQVAPCVADIDVEVRRRASQRTEKAAPARSSKSRAPDKARAAPAADQADQTRR